MKILKILGNLNSAIGILLLIAFFSIFGTILEQNQSIEFYKVNYPDNGNFINWKLIQLFSLDHVYSTWWFLFLLFIFGLSLLTCTFSRQIPILKIGQRWFFYKNKDQLNKFLYRENLSCSNTFKFIYSLNQDSYSILQQGNRFYANKGLLGRISPIVVHFSLILVLLGSISGSLFGFTNQELIPKGETFHIQNILSEGFLSPVTQSLAVRVNDFWFDYKSDQVSIEQFYSDLSILTPLGFEKVHKTIFVNRPLNFNQLTFYQTDWNISSIRLKLNKVIQLPIRNLITENKSKIWFTTFRLSSNPEDTFSIVFQNIHNNFIIYNSKGEQLKQVQINEPFYLGDKEVILFDLINTTGLQIKFDPGIILVYFGFGLLIISVFSSYISHSQVWGLKTQLDFSIGGSTNREQVFFEQELKTILRKLNK